MTNYHEFHSESTSKKLCKSWSVLGKITIEITVAPFLTNIAQLPFLHHYAMSCDITY